MYIMMNQTEDGLLVHTFDTEDQLLEEITELTSEDIVPEHRAVFMDRVPDWTDESHHYFIVGGSVIIPKPVERVVEWTLNV